MRATPPKSAMPPKKEEEEQDEVKPDPEDALAAAAAAIMPQPKRRKTTNAQLKIDTATSALLPAHHTHRASPSCSSSTSTSRRSSQSSNVKVPAKVAVRPHRKSAEAALRKISTGEGGAAANQQHHPSQTSNGGSSADSTRSLREGSCEHADCPIIKSCALSLAGVDCLGARVEGGAQRLFHHVSRAEHVCTVCYEHIYKSPLGERFASWKQRWALETRVSPSVKQFIQDQLLPFWMRCTKCAKWRAESAEHTPHWTHLLSFTCSTVGLDCSIDEPLAAAEASRWSWIRGLVVAPLLHNSPVLHFVKDEYFYAEIGQSPIETDWTLDKAIAPKGVLPNIRPFYIPTLGHAALVVRPDTMDHDERQAFPEYSYEHVPFCAIRNLIVALWNLNPCRFLKFEDCLPHLKCRGLARIWYAGELRRCYDYMNKKGLINYGVLDIPPAVSPIKISVIIIGAGISGLAAARQLRSNGVQRVTVLEAKTRFGGRIQDDWSLGVAVGCGAQLITGVVNNPLVVMCHQLGVPFRLLGAECPLLDADAGRRAPARVDRMVDEHFNCCLDVLATWRRMAEQSGRKNATDTTSLLEHLEKAHRSLVHGAGLKWTPEQERLFQWQVGNVEFSCGTNLSEVSSQHWDQNEAAAQFAGEHALLEHGGGEIVRRLAHGTDVRCSHQVSLVDWSSPQHVTVHCTNKKKFTCDKVIFTLPLAVWKKGAVRVQPSLPEKKMAAIENLGAGLIEKIALRFPTCFWQSLLKSDGTLDYFGHVPKGAQERGLFNMFYDFSNRSIESHVLMTYVCGESVGLVNQLSDTEVVERVMDALRSIFPNEDVPSPTGWIVTHWGTDPNIGMSYSFVGRNATGQDYDELAATVDNRLFFAGEATNRYHPQTMSGAYVSALRETGKLLIGRPA